jgi:hypothetical protein
LQEGGCGGDSAAGLRTAGGALELSRDLLVRARSGKGAMPRPSVRVRFRIARLRKGFVHTPTSVRRRRAVDGRAYERVPEPDMGADFQQLRGLRWPECAGSDLEPSSCAPHQRCVAEWVGSRQPQEPLRCAETNPVGAEGMAAPAFAGRAGAGPVGFLLPDRTCWESELSTGAGPGSSGHPADRVALIGAGAKFATGVLVDRPGESASGDAHAHDTVIHRP